MESDIDLVHVVGEQAMDGVSMVDLELINETTSELFKKKVSSLKKYTDRMKNHSTPRADSEVVNMVALAEECRQYWTGGDITKLDGYDVPLTRRVSFVKVDTTKIYGRSVNVSYDNACDSIKGGALVKGLELPNECIYSNRGDGSMQAIYWPVEGDKKKGSKKPTLLNNCAFIDSSTYTCESVKACTITRNMQINEYYTSYQRGGAAGKQNEIFPAKENHLNPKFFGRLDTKRDFQFVHGTANNPKLVYTSNKTGKQSRMSMKSEIHGHQYKAPKLLDMLVADEYMRDQAIKAMHSRLQAQLIASAKKVKVDSGYPETLNNGEHDLTWKHTNETWGDYHNNREAWREVDQSLTDYQIWLLEYYLRTGLQVNLEPVRAHWDTSEGHYFETLQLGMEVNIQKVGHLDAATFANEEVFSKSGLIVCPMQLFALKLRPGKDLLHALFTKTIHVPNERGGNSPHSDTQHGRAQS